MKGFVWCPRRVQRKFTLDSQGASKKSWEKKMPRLGLQGWLRISQTLFFFFEDVLLKRELKLQK